jgi:hypothetical protein
VCVRKGDGGSRSGSGWVAVVSFDSGGQGGHFEPKIVGFGVLSSELQSIDWR